MQPILRADHVQFKNIIRYPEINIRAQEATFIQGPSGCGKSTLLKLFNGTVSPESGTVYFHDKNMEEINTIVLRRKVLLVSQAMYLFNGTIEENFVQYYRYRGLEVPDKEKMQGYLALCRADFPLDSVCDTMSGGERQRIYIAICLSLMPEVLMLDEPSSALDSVVADQMIGSIKKFCTDQKITLLVVSHDSILVDKYADTIIHLERSTAQ